MFEKTIAIVAALICDGEGRMLVVRKRGTDVFMQPGGKREPGEDDATALARELAEELGCCVVPGSERFLGRFSSIAANEPGWIVEAGIYAVRIHGAIAPQAEIVETRWISSEDAAHLALAPLTRNHVLPLAFAPTS